PHRLPREALTPPSRWPAPELSEATPVTARQNAPRSALVAALMIVPLFAALVPPAAAYVNPSSCVFGAGDLCVATYNGPDAIMQLTGETTLGVNWNTGKIMMSARSIPLLVSTNPPGGLQKTARVSFDDAQTPPVPT